MTFTLDAQVAEVLAAAIARSGPPPAPPVGDVASRRVALDAMLGYFNNEAQPSGKVGISDHRVVTPDGAALLARWYRQPSGDSRAAVLYLHGGGMIVGSVPIFDGLVPVRGPHRRPDALPGIQARTRTPSPHAGRGRLRRPGMAH
jgi:acetyl esterase/lipase